MHESYRRFAQETLQPWLAEHTAEGYFESADQLNIHYHEAVKPEEQASIVIVHGFCEFFGKYHETAYRFYEAGYSVSARLLGEFFCHICA